jgi:hypothetical protein
MHQQRIEPRRPFMRRISVAWDDADGNPRTQSGVLEDISHSGAGVCVNKPITAGTKVTIRGTHRELAGRVRHCRTEEFKYFVGIQLDAADEEWQSAGGGL